MARNYECVLIIDTGTTDEEKEKIIQRVRELLAQSQGEIEKIEEWGKRAFAYPINKKTEGIYLWLALKGNPEFLKELEAYFKLNEKILRHLILLRETPKKVKIQKVKPKEVSKIPVQNQAKQSDVTVESFK